MKIEAEDADDTNKTASVSGSCASYVTGDSNDTTLVTINIDTVGKSCEFIISTTFSQGNGDVSVFKGTLRRISGTQYQIDANSEVFNKLPAPSR